jgi:hypothetical protein
MHFVTILKSLDDLLYEVMSWLIFYPITLWRSLTQPLVMMRYADSELKDTPERQYPDVLSPPLFLLLTLILSHLVELAVVGESPLIANKHGLAELITDDTSLIALRMVAMAVFPVTMSARMVHARRQKLERETLRKPFYSQCYAAGPLALMFSVGTTLGQCIPGGARLVGALLVLGAVVWFLVLEALWFRRLLRCGWWRALGNAGRAYAEGWVLLSAASFLIVSV